MPAVVVGLDKLVNTTGKAMARAQGYPALTRNWRLERNVEIIVGSSPGGSFDITARGMQKILLDTNLVNAAISVVNKPGGDNALSWVYMNGHAEDGHYLGLVFPTLITNRLMGTGRTSLPSSPKTARGRRSSRGTAGATIT